MEMYTERPEDKKKAAEAVAADAAEGAAPADEPKNKLAQWFD